LSIYSLVVAISSNSAKAQETDHKPKSLREISDPHDQLKEVDTKWPECREYIPESGPCKVIVNFSRSEESRHLAYAPWDVTVKPGGEAVILVQHGSPFVTCTLTAY
jgi:hypothetical protein